MLKSIKRNENLSKMAFREIRDNILRSGLKPGDKLPSEAELGRQLGCGKSPVREALRSLETLGIIKVVHGTGAILSTFNFDIFFENLAYDLQANRHDLEELFEIREAFETFFLDRIIAKIDSKTISRLEKLTGEMEEAAQRGTNFTRQDCEFHRLLFESLDNIAALKLLRTFWNFLSKSRSISPTTTTPRATAKSHRKILDAIKEDDILQAKEAMREHFLELQERLRARQEKNAPTQGGS